MLRGTALAINLTSKSVRQANRARVEETRSSVIILSSNRPLFQLLLGISGKVNIG